MRRHKHRGISPILVVMANGKNHSIKSVEIKMVGSQRSSRLGHYIDDDDYEYDCDDHSWPVKKEFVLFSYKRHVINQNLFFFSSYA